MKDKIQNPKLKKSQQSRKKRIFQSSAIILFRLALVFAILEAGLRFSGYARLMQHKDSNIILPAQTDNYRILVLGESMTSGNCPCWADEFERLLNSKSKEIQFKVINVARAGSLSSTMVSSLDDYLDYYRPNMVITMIGINDPPVTAAKDNAAFSLKDSRLVNLDTYKFGRYLFGYFIGRLKEIGGRIIKKAPAIARQNIPMDLIKSEYIDIGEVDKLIGQGEIANENFWKTEKSLEKFIQENPMNETAKMQRARLYLSFYGSKDALKRFEQEYEEYMNVRDSFNAVGWHYLHNNMAKDAEQLFDVISKEDPKMLAQVFIDIGRQYRGKNVFMRQDVYDSLPQEDKIPNPQETKKYIEMGEKIGKDYANVITQTNYQKIYETLNKRKIRLIAVQYPLLSLDGLRVMFNGDEDITFVSNEENFKKELKDSKFEDFFRGPDFGIFGHTTKKGADLIAENVAGAVLNDLRANVI